MHNFRRFVYVVLGLCLLPLGCVVLSTLLAALLGCELSEAGGEACVVLGLDVGGFLSLLFALGWIALVTLPLMGLILAGWAGVEGLALWRRRQRQRRSARQMEV